jgi:hypothetical protein
MISTQREKRPLPLRTKRPAGMLVVMACVLLLAACGQNRRTTVGSGFLQKRTFRPGWHLDLAHGERQPHGTKTSRPKGLTANPGTEVTAAREHVPQPVLDLDPSRPSTDLVAALETPPAAESLHLAPERIRERSHNAVADRDPENIMPRKRLDGWAIPAFLLVLAGIASAFLTNSGLLVAVLLVLGIVLAAISLRRMRSDERSGKGFALFALVAGTMAALITAMVIVRSGF